MERVLDCVITDQRIGTMVYSQVTSEFSNGFAGSYLLGEYSVLNGLSFGATLNAIDFLVNGLLSDAWILEGSVFLRVDLPLKKIWDRWNMHILVETNASPLWSDQDYNVSGFGLINLFCTASLNVNVLDSPEMQLYAYADMKYITSIINPLKDTELLLASVFPTESRDPAVSYVYGLTHRFALCPGLEMNWGNCIISCGWNLRIADVTVPGNWTLYFLSLEQLLGFDSAFDWMNRIELSWRWKF